jgi:DNA-binding CsgD family transcriptional regulator
MTTRSEPGTDLTDRELVVVRLVAQGLTSNQIGTDLFISPRTVDAHVRSVYRKTGTRTRTQLASWYLDGAQ